MCFYWCCKTYKKARSQTILGLTILKLGEKFSKNLRFRNIFDGNEDVMEYVLECVS